MLGNLSVNSAIAVVISQAKAHHQNHTSIVYCLMCVPLADTDEIRPYGEPFRLLVDKRYVIRNDSLRKKRINVGSVILTNGKDYSSTTTRKMKVSDVLGFLKFEDKSAVVAYHGIAEAFPNAVIHEDSRGISQNSLGLQYALVSVLSITTVDDRILAVTRLGEEIDLNNRSRNGFKDYSIEEKTLPVRRPTSQEDVGDVILISFGEQTNEHNFLANCGAILLHASADDESTSIRRDADLSGSASEGPDSYKMKSTLRGMCLILNNVHYGTKEKNRSSAILDEQKLRVLFEDELYFEVHAHRDLKRYQMLEMCETFGKLRHDNYDAFVCIIMSHGGSRDCIEDVDGRTIGVEQLMSEFTTSRCPSLAGKPKVFIIQACRGEMQEQFLKPMEECADSRSCHADSTLARSTFPEEADFLLAFASVPGYVAFRRENYGSFFIQTLVETMKADHKDQHLYDILTKVTRLVTEKANQVPSPVSTLRYKLYL